MTKVNQPSIKKSDRQKGLRVLDARALDLVRGGKSIDGGSITAE